MAFLRQWSGFNNQVYLTEGDSSNKHIMKWEQLDPWRCVWIQTLSKGLWALFNMVLQIAWLAGAHHRLLITEVSLHTVTVKWPGGFGAAAPEKTLIYRPSDTHIKRWKAFRVQLPCLWRPFTNASCFMEAFAAFRNAAALTADATYLSY